MLAYLQTERSSGKLASEALPQREFASLAPPIAAGLTSQRRREIRGQLCFCLSGSLATPCPLTLPPRKDAVSTQFLPTSATSAHWVDLRSRPTIDSLAPLHQRRIHSIPVLACSPCLCSLAPVAFKLKLPRYLANRINCVLRLHLTPRLRSLPSFFP